MTNRSPQVPEGEIGDLIGVFDFFDPEHAERVEQFAAYARAHCPVAYSSARGGQYIVTRYEDACQVLEDPATFSSRPEASIIGTKGVRMPPIDTDPPAQRAYRKILNPYFHPRRLAAQESTVREVARTTIARWAGTGQCDVITEFAGPFVTDVLAKVVFAEPDEAVFRTANEFVDRISHGESSAFADFRQFLLDYVNRRRATPGLRDNVVWELNNVTIEGRPLSEEERVGAVLILFIGGLDTTKVAIGNIIHQMTLDATLEPRLRTPGWERTILEELLRYQAPVTALGRVATRDAIVGEQPIKAGERLVVHFASANHDERMFEDPGRLVFDRSRNPHLSFGLGVHRCIGMHLARLQIRVAVEEFLKVATDVRLQPDATLTRHAGVTPIFHRLPVYFSRPGASD